MNTGKSDAALNFNEKINEEDLRANKNEGRL